MQTTSNLKEFIAHARKKGMDYPTIRTLLLAEGWKEKDIGRAMIAEGLDMDVPHSPDVGGARDAFFHLLAFVSLYTVVISFFAVAFTIINYLLPDVAEGRVVLDYVRDSLRWPMAGLIVMFPMYLWMSRKVLAEMRQFPQRSTSGVRRWLTYLTLFLAAVTMLTDVTTLVFYVLQGEIALRFILKVVIVFVVSGGIFMYYLKSLRESAEERIDLHRTYIAVSSGLVVATLVGAFYISGSPLAERDRRLDDLRLSHLQQIQQEVYAQTLGPVNAQGVATMKAPLPKSLEDIATNAEYLRLSTNDPETGVPYEYTVTGTSTFELCATFDEQRTAEYDIFWDHPAGHYCFTTDVLTQ